MTTSDQHSAVQPPRTLSPTASSASSSAPGLRFRLWLPGDPPAPKCHRTERGELDIEKITSEFVAWQRVAWGGADPGGRHYPEVRRSAGAMFTAGAGRHRVELDDRAGRHVPPFERQHHTLAKAVETFERAGVF